MVCGFVDVCIVMFGVFNLLVEVVVGFVELGVPLYDGYGFIEVALVVILDVLVVCLKLGFIGCLLFGVEVELCDADGDAVEDGDFGWVFIRGVNLFFGYWLLGEDGLGEDGWFGIGDIVVCDDDGDLCFVGCMFDLVIVNGFNVYLVEVEVVFVV